MNPVIITKSIDRTDVNPICSSSKYDTDPSKSISPDNRIVIYKKKYILAPPRIFFFCQDKVLKDFKFW